MTRQQLLLALNNLHAMPGDDEARLFAENVLTTSLVQPPIRALVEDTLELVVSLPRHDPSNLDFDIDPRWENMSNDELLCMAHNILQYVADDRLDRGVDTQ